MEGTSGDTVAAFIENRRGATQHLVGRSPSEGEEQDTLRGGATRDQLRYPVDQGSSLARPRSGDDEVGAFGRTDRL